MKGSGSFEKRNSISSNIDPVNYSAGPFHFIFRGFVELSRRDSDISLNIVLSYNISNILTLVKQYQILSKIRPDILSMYSATRNIRLIVDLVII